MTRVLPMLVLAALPLLATTDEDWRALYYKGQQLAVEKSFARAESVYAEALNKAELFGKDDVRVASTEQALGETLRGDKKLSDAEAALQRAVNIYAVTPGDSSIEFAEAQFDLAGVLLDEG